MQYQNAVPDQHTDVPVFRMAEIATPIYVPVCFALKLVTQATPSHHHARKLPGDQGQWVIEIADEIPKIVVTKTDPPKPDIRSMNRKYFNFQ